MKLLRVWVCLAILCLKIFLSNFSMYFFFKNCSIFWLFFLHIHWDGMFNGLHLFVIQCRLFYLRLFSLFPFLTYECKILLIYDLFSAKNHFRNIVKESFQFHAAKKIRNIFKCFEMDKICNVVSSIGLYEHFFLFSCQSIVEFRFQFVSIRNEWLYEKAMHAILLLLLTNTLHIYTLTH